MADKMYYSQEEAVAKIGSLEKLDSLEAGHEIRVFRDGAKKMYKADEIDALSSEVVLEEPLVDLSPEDTGEIELIPADDTSDRSAIGLADTDMGTFGLAGKDDTVITSEGMSIFDDEDLDIDTANPMAKTGITPSMADQISLEGAGSGSGLLDLTRESDDTSLGAEVLDHIDMEGSFGTSIQGEAAGATASYAPVPDMVESSFDAQPMAMPAAVAVAPEIVIDPSAGFFSGLLVGSCLVALLLGMVTLGGLRGIVPDFVETLNTNMLPVLGGCVVVVVISGVVGLFLGKSAAAKQLEQVSLEG